MVKMNGLDRQLTIFLGSFLALGLLLSGSLTARAQTYDCVVDPSRVVRVSSAISGVLAEVSVDRGDRVEKGDAIAKLAVEGQDVLVEINRLRAESTAQLDAQKARNGVLRKELQRAETLFKKGVGTAQRLDELRAELEIGLREIERLTVEQQLAKLELKRSQRLLAERSILSPISGVVTERVLSPGEFIHEQTYIVTIASLDPLMVETFLPVKMYSDIVPGRQAEIRLEGATPGSYKARVVVVDQVFDAASGTFGVRLALPNADSKLPAGQVCTVSFPGS
ncbi:efflux RND transporter periplasmic adaptor subunit [Roseibium sp.]|uniref:efflux RND transporter periplasmic adaptor subunit n=1 Tax=Roseibium sp. TaxID=1936156 RepID=UPI003D0EC400